MRFDDLDWDDCVFNPAKAVNMCRIAVYCFLCGKILIIQFKTELQNLVSTYKYKHYFINIKYNTEKMQRAGAFAFC